MAIGETDAGCLRQLKQGAQVPAHGPAIPFQVLGYLVVGGESAAHFPFPLNGGETGPDGPDAVDAIGQGGPQIHCLDVGDVAEVTGVVVVRHLDPESVIGGGGKSEAPLLAEGHDEIGVGHPGVTRNVVGSGIQTDRPQGGRHPGGALDVDVGVHVDDAAGEGQGIEPGHGGGVAGEHAGIVGDGGFTREGSPHAGGGLLRELEAGSLHLARQQQEGYEGGVERRMHGLSSG